MSTGLWMGTLASSLAAGSGDFEPIATLDITSPSLPVFTSIPQTYQHLQIRAFIKFHTGPEDVSSLYLTMNDDNTSGNYSYHGIYSTNSSVTSISSYPQTHAWCGYGTASADKYGVFIVDILDYSNTTKTKTINTISGGEFDNTNGRVSFSTTAWFSTAAITKIGTFGGGYNITAGNITIYGVLAP